MVEKSLWIVRHGATQLNNQSDMSDDRVRGWTNVPLSSDGIEDAHKAASDLLGSGINLILSSDLQRAMQTAEIIGKLNHAPVQPLPLLRSWNLGELQGRTSKEAEPVIKHYACEIPDTPVPGGGESFNTFKSRAMRGLNHGIAEVSAGRTVCIVTHHRTERLYFAWKDGGYLPDFSIKLSTFLAKGEAPGDASEFPLPPSGQKTGPNRSQPLFRSQDGGDRLGMAGGESMPTEVAEQGRGDS